MTAHPTSALDAAVAELREKMADAEVARSQRDKFPQNDLWIGKRDKDTLIGLTSKHGIIETTDAVIIYALTTLPLLLAELDALREAAGSGAGEDWRTVPLQPTEAQWGGLARDLVMWDRFASPTGSALYAHLKSSGRDIPQWLRDEIPDVVHVPPKGTVAACIYKAMVLAAPPLPAPPAEAARR